MGPLFRDQIFRNRDFFPKPNFSETETLKNLANLANAFKLGNFLWERKLTMTNTLGLKITFFFVIVYGAIDQGYMGLSLASC